MSKRTIVINEVCNLNSETMGSLSQPDEIQYLDTGNITRNRIDNVQILNRNVAPFPSRAQRKVSDKTIIYSTVRPIQEHFGFLSNPADNFIVSTGFVTIDVTDQEVDPKFLYYALTQKHITTYLQTIATNNVSSYPSVNPDDVGNLKFHIPKEKKLQQQIAAVLTAIDEKIELNNRINAELEAMAKTLYDYWFVQFDFPDKNGQPYKSSGGKIRWSAELKREIPEGWEAKKLKEIATIIMGQSPKGVSYNTEKKGIPLINGAADYEGGLLLPKVYTTIPTRLCQKDDMIFCIRATIGNLTFAENTFCLGRGVAGVRSNELYLTEQIYFRLLQEINRFKKQATGSIIVGITKDDLLDSFSAIPPSDISERFHLLLAPLFAKQRLVNLENYQLSELRDWLLPMLMNGQVKVN